MALSRTWHEFFDQPIPNMALRIVCMLIGLAFTAFAVALSRATGLGTSVISCIPTVLSFLTPLSLGTFTFSFNMLFILIQIVLLRRDYKPLQLLCIPFVMLFAVIIDFFVPICELIPMSNYGLQILFTVIAACCTAFGIWLQVQSALILLPGDGVVITISRVFGFDFAKTKIAFDTSNVVIGAALSLATMGGLFGVREGTIFMALAVGPMIKLWGKIFPHIEYFLPIEGHPTLIADDKKASSSVKTAASTQTPLVITISRQYGSGGREIGRNIAKQLGVPIYDETLIKKTARESGLTIEFVRSHEEDVRRGILYNLYTQNYAYIGRKPNETDHLFLAQARVITKLADQGSCVLVGRNADFILKDRPNCFNVFVHAPLEARIARVANREHCNTETAEQRIKDIDHERAQRSLEYTNSHWGDAKSYHLTVDSSIANPSDIAHLICEIAESSALEHRTV